MNRRPDRRPRIADRGRTARDLVRGRDFRHVLDWHFDRELQTFLPARIDDGDGAVLHGACACKFVFDLRVGVGLLRRGSRIADCGFGSAKVSRHFVERTLCRRQSDALRRGCAQRVEALERQRKMRSALGRHERVDLVDDDRLDRSERLARVRGQQEIQRLRRRDEDVCRFALKSRALGLRRIAGANRDQRRRVRLARSFGDLRDAGERRPQIALDVDGERFERRHVQHAAAPGFRRRRREHQPVEAPQKCRERFPAAGRREDQRGVAAGDRRPAECLRPRRFVEGLAEPRAHGRTKRRERIGSRAGHAAIL